MPLITESNLPAYSRLKDEGHNIFTTEEAAAQDIRELHIGILNMMPDAALEATERQFLRLLASSNRIVQIHIHFFSLDCLPRSDQARAHIDRYYETFSDICRLGLDALIISGANVSQPRLIDETFWKPLSTVFEWGLSHVTSILCSCLATHALIQYQHGIQRNRLPQKCWGVYSHQVDARQHPLVHDVNTRIEVPHSRYNAIHPEAFHQAGLPVLIKSQAAGVLLATSQDGIRVVYFQGHPEFDTLSLLKEYKREVHRYFLQQRDDYPPYPEYYFSPAVSSILANYQSRVIAALESSNEIPEMPESQILPLLDNTWRDSARAIINNWLGIIYRLTHFDRHLPFMPDVDPDTPLASLRKE